VLRVQGELEERRRRYASAAGVGLVVGALVGALLQSRIALEGGDVMARDETTKTRRGFIAGSGMALGGCLLCTATQKGAASADTTAGRGGDKGGVVPADDSLLGYCGLYCGGCKAYQDTTSGKANVQEDATPCLGCASQIVAPWCQDCAIKRCCREKALRTCLHCEDYPCEKLVAFMNDPRYPYHKEVPANMARLDEIGLTAWLKEQSARWICAQCGKPYHWFARTCPTCGTRVNQKYWPDE
jgi:hypothetical protein